MLQVKLQKSTPENSCLIELSQGKFAIVDRPEPARLRYFKWRAIRCNFRWYAVSNVIQAGRRTTIAMHRFIAETPSNEICHHLNKNSLDNRLGNLMNMTNRQHAQLHKIRRWKRKNQRITTI